MEYQLLNNAILFKEGERVLYLDFLTPNILRVSTDISHASDIVLPVRSPVKFTLSQEEGGYRLTGPLFQVQVDLNLFLRFAQLNDETLLEETSYEENPRKPHLHDDLAAKEGHAVEGQDCYEHTHAYLLHEDEHFYGLGDHVGPLDKREYRYINYNTDYPQAHEDDVLSLYKDFPFFLVKRLQASFGIYVDNPYKTRFDFGADQRQFSFSELKGSDDYYFLYGPSPKEVVSTFASLSGKMSLPPRWSLGYQQSRWSYADAPSVMNVVKSFKAADIPLEVVHLDIDYMEGYRIFTVSSSRFPAFSDFVANLRKEGIKVVTILDPGIKVDPDYSLYQEAIKGGYVATYQGEVYVNAVWPGDSVYPSFNEEKTRAWWADKCATFVKTTGVAGLWCDMNEPASFKGPLPSDVLFGKEKHEAVHNLYGHWMSKATHDGLLKANPELRPFVITRACFSGSQRYTTVWTGDNQSNWADLRLSPGQLLSLALSGMSFVGTDIGGFGGDCPSELMNRWIEFGVFSPFCRNHCAVANFYQEPYVFDAKTLANYRQWVYFRYRIVPYFYDLFYEHSQSGLPVLRPLFLEYPSDPVCDTLSDEFLLGSSLLVAPILDPGVSARSVYLPQGHWYPFFNKGEALLSGYHLQNAALGECLVYAKEGAIIPLYPTGVKNLDNEPKELVLKVFPGTGSLLHYQDDGTSLAYQKGAYNLYLFTNHDGLVSCNLLHQGYPTYERIRVITPSGETLLNLN